MQRVFFIGLPGLNFSYGRKGYLAADCTGRRVPAHKRQEAMHLEQQGPFVVQGQEGWGKPTLANRERRQRSDAERARRRVAKMQKRKHARISEGLGVQIIYRP